MNRRIATGGRLTALSLSLLIAACGGGGSGVGGGPVATPPPPPTTPPPATTDPAYLASGPTPFTVDCDSPSTGTAFINAEVEPYLAVDPTDANHLIGVWQQDRWSNGSARGLVSGVSFDGGQTWARTPLPVSRCGGGTFANGGDYARATDPWVTIAPDGTAYAMALSTTGSSFVAGSVNAMLVLRSTDRGRTWSAPTTLIRDGSGFFNDKNALTADPTNANFVYATWDRLVSGDNGGPTYFARTTNGGANWETARSIYDPGPTSQTIGNLIVVAPDGTLVNLFTQLDRIGTSTLAHLAVIRSTNQGQTWSAPVRISNQTAVGARDPQSGAAVRDGSLLAQIAAAPSGHLFVVWQDARFNNGSFDAIALSRSTDGGATWSTPARVNTVASNVAAFTPSVHVRPDGTVGVSYYDFRSNTAAASLLTDYWLARSSDGGVTWRETRVSPAFDLGTAPNAGGLFLGDYQALKSRGNTFVPFFVRTSSGDLNNRTDVFAAPQVSITTAAASAQITPMSAGAQPLLAQPPLSPIATARMQQRASAQIERNMQQRVPGWGDATMRPPR